MIGDGLREILIDTKFIALPADSVVVVDLPPLLEAEMFGEVDVRREGLVCRLWSFRRACKFGGVVMG